MNAPAQSSVVRPTGGPAWLDDATLDAVRPQVRALLEASPGFRQMSVADQQAMARTMVRVASYMANPDGLARQELAPGGGVLVKPATPAMPATQGLAAALADATEQARGRASDKVGTFAGNDFRAGSVEQGAANFRRYVDSVDFPAFVGGLIQNVFQAIVDATIQQMNAYGELLKSVAQTVDQFAQDNISLNNARDWLVEKFPGDIGVDTSDGDGAGPRIAVTNEDDADAALLRVNQELQIAKPVTDLTDPEQEGRLVQAARLQMARSRQQMLSSMVILGINRIVVTDGAINAKVVFDFRGSDEAGRKADASMYDRTNSTNTTKSAAGVHFGWGAAGRTNVNSQSHMATVHSSVSEDSESKQEMKAKLTGEVRVNFKSDYFPMEKLASPGMIATIQGNATPFDPNAPAKRTAGAAAAPAAAAA